MTQDEKNVLLNEQYSIILTNEAKLSSTEYVAAKIAEGRATKAEYKEKLAMRQECRDNINAAQDEIKRLEAIEVEDPTMEDLEE